MAQKDKTKKRRNGFAQASKAERQAAEAARHEAQQAFIKQYDAQQRREMSGAEALALCHQAVEAKVFGCFNEITSAVKSQFGGRLAELSQKLQNPDTTNPGQLMVVLHERVNALRMKPQAASKSAHGRKGAPKAAHA